MENFGYVSVIALFCYVFLMLIFLAAKKNRLINSFLALMGTMICWTGGSMLMRFRFWPSYQFWYHVSLAGILFLPYIYFLFVNEMAERKAGVWEKLYIVILAAIVAVNAATGYFLAPPEILGADGRYRFVYHIDWHVSWLFLVCGIVLVHMFLIIFQHFRINREFRKRFEPVLLGILLLFLGQLILMFPVFHEFPIDIVAGILNAFLLIYALNERRLFQLRMLASQWVCYGVGLLLSLVLFYNLSPYLTDFMLENFSGMQKYYPMFFVLLFALIVILLTYGWQTMMKNVFVKDELHQADLLREFSEEVSRSLRLDDILEETVQVVKKTTAVQNVYICLQDGSGDYRTIYSDQPLKELSFTMRQDNPVVVWLGAHPESMMIREFQYTVEYKSMWETEKQQLIQLGVECCMGLRNEGGLVGMILLSNKDGKGRISYGDRTMVESISSIASIAIKNARLYEKAYSEARTDELTGLLNRKCFYEVLEQEYERNKEGSLVLVIFNVDDFKLYNQLYGMEQGDLALQNIARIISASVGTSGTVARYSGKEFAILLPGYDIFAARTLTETIRKQIYEMDCASQDYRLKVLTVSAGISAAPYGASSAAELVNNADMAVYHVKHNGKNGIQVFDVKVQNESEHRKRHANVEAYHDYETTIYALTAAIDTKDHYTFSHSNNVAYYAMELGREIGLNDDMVEIIRQAGLLHDIGKIGIPEEILNKPGKLTPEEYEIMRSHVEASIGIIRHLPSLDYVIPAVIGHHERYDGDGYPRRVKGENIPIAARILCIVDSFDAMISERSYKSPMPVEQALKILEQEAGHQFDPVLAEAFVRCIREFRIKPILSENSRTETRK